MIGRWTRPTGHPEAGTTSALVEAPVPVVPVSSADVEQDSEPKDDDGRSTKQSKSSKAKASDSKE